MMSRATPSGHHDCIDIAMPLDREYTATLRMLAASLGADAGFSVDEIDDFRLALSEVFSMMADRHPNGRLGACFTIDGPELRVHLSSGASTAALQPDELALNILNAVVDSYQLVDDGVTLTKGASERARS